MKKFGCVVMSTVIGINVVCMSCAKPVVAMPKKSEYARAAETNRRAQRIQEASIKNAQAKRNQNQPTKKTVKVQRQNNPKKGQK